MAKIGYARVSSRGQNDDSQIDALKRGGLPGNTPALANWLPLRPA